MRFDLLSRAIRKIFAAPPLPLAKRFAVGRGTYGEPNVLWDEGSATLKVGAFCSIAHGVTIFLGGNHRPDWITTYPFSVFRRCAKAIPGHPATKGDVVIGHDVWIGMNATILSGVRIGNGAVVGACAVVSRDIPAYGIAAGNPAKVVRMRFPENEVASLESLAWWEWSDPLINEAMPLLLASDIPALCAFAVGKGLMKSPANSLPQ